MNHILKALIFIWLIPQSEGHFAEFFGASSLTASRGGQAASPGEDPANNYYAPALIPGSPVPQASLQGFRLHYSLKGTPRGDDRITFNYWSLHLTLPTPKLPTTTLGFSLLTPAPILMEINTGDSNFIDYVMYQGRNRRTTFYGNVAKKWSEGYSVGLGFYLGLNTTSQVNSTISLDDRDEQESEYSDAHLRGTVRSKVAAMASVAKISPHSSLALTYQQGMKQSISFSTRGKESIIGVPFAMEMSSLLAYDPTIIRLSHHYGWNHIKLYSQLEYQLWESYLPALIKIEPAKDPPHTIKPSKDLGPFSPRNILVPKLGMSVRFQEKHTTSLGLGYRPTPLGKSFYAPGQSVDADKTTIALGHRVHDTPIGNIDFSIQYHNLIKKGELGGYLLNTSVGLTFEL